MIYITYNNTDHTDGAGSQIQRQLSLWLIAKHYGLRYIHSPLKHLEYQGLKCLEQNQSDSTQLDKYNQLFVLPSEQEPDHYDSVQNIFNLSESDIDRWKSSTETVLLRVLYAHTFIDRNIHILQTQQHVYEWMIQTISRPIQIAVHVRRGEIRILDTHRLLPKSYYISCMKSLESFLDSKCVPYEFHVYGEYNEAPIIVTPDHHGIVRRIPGTIVMESDKEYFDDFKDCKNVHFHLNECPIEALCAFINADCFIASKSSFSYVAAMLNKKGCVFFSPDFWCGLSPDWIPYRSEEDVYNNSSKLCRILQIDN